MALTLWSVMTISAGETAYLFSYFINDSKDGLHLAYSYDGLNWTCLLYTSVSGKLATAYAVCPRQVRLLRYLSPFEAVSGLFCRGARYHKRACQQ